MFTKKSSSRRVDLPDTYSPKPEYLPDTALAAIVSYKKQKDVNDFVSFVLDALERNAHWLNNLVDKQNSFRCAFMIGSGPNRFQIKQIIYPQQDAELKLEVDCRDSDDYDKVAIAALLKLTSADIDRVLKYTKTRFFENTLMREELYKGKLIGISYAVLRPIYDDQFRLSERIVIGNTLRYGSPMKRRLVDKSVTRNVKKAKKVS
ncbi:uncharacterized protein LOC123721645 [Papilio machaon]|uniref:uncharacterized protein LOC123721645 n=1 Tax=Papilio machaon TaxID=76193 RepID=UPI001E665A9D|nr:uncharacterized protein LOC123721645 [Papilio machaon]